MPVEDQTDQVKINLTDHFLESPIGNENPSCENDSGDVLPTKEIFGRVSLSDHESTGVSDEPESVNHPSTTESGVMAVPDDRAVPDVRSRNAQKSFNKRAKENEKFARLKAQILSLFQSAGVSPPRLLWRNEILDWATTIIARLVKKNQKSSGINVPIES